MRRLALVLLAACSPGLLAAQSTDLTGEWLLTVDVDGSVSTPSLTLEQSGDSLSGRYVSETLGRARVRGTVTQERFTISFTASLQGQSVPVRYRGSIQEDGTLEGRMDLADGMISGTFSAKRKPPPAGVVAAPLRGERPPARPPSSR